jgi:NAD(P)-dependent dehydrogenase (short-subunit alcohol dehydrogenase family)
MSAIHASKLLRPGLLNGVSVLLAGASAHADGRRSLRDAVREACAELGARVCECELDLDAPSSQQDGALEDSVAGLAVASALADGASLELLVVDCASFFSRAAESARKRSPGEHDQAGVAREALRACLDSSWNATQAVANAAFLPGSPGGRIAYLAPPSDAGELADAARAGLENLARTLSIEWARHRITPVTIVPAAGAGGVVAGEAGAGEAGGADEVAALTAYLASPAGAYFSGCLLDLRRGIY